MIIRERPSGWRLFFILRGSILSRIKGQLLLTIGLSMLVTWAHGQLFHTKLTLTPIPFSLIGLALAIFLGFRNNASYDRWWEGRRLWGGLVVHTRVLSRLLLTHLRDPQAGGGLARRQVLRLIGFCHAFKHGLRGSADGESAAFVADGENQGVDFAINAPDAILRKISMDLARAAARGDVDPTMVVEMERQLGELAAVQGGCERIRSTPLPFSYTLLLHRTAYLYCLMLPFGLVDTIGLATPLVVGLIAYTFFGLDALGDEIEEPFGVAPNDLPLDALCRRIEIDLLAALGETELPPPLEPIDGFLS